MFKKLLVVMLVCVCGSFSEPSAPAPSLWSKFKSAFDTALTNNPLLNGTVTGYPTAPLAFKDFCESGDVILSRDIAEAATFTPETYNHSYRIPVSYTIDNMSEIKGCVVVMVIKYKSRVVGTALADLQAAVSSVFTGDQFSLDNQTGTLYIRDRVFLYYIKALEGWVFIGGESIFGMKRFLDFFNMDENPLGQRSTGEPTVELKVEKKENLSNKEEKK